MPMMHLALDAKNIVSYEINVLHRPVIQELRTIFLQLKNANDGAILSFVEKKEDGETILRRKDELSSEH